MSIILRMGGLSVSCDMCGQGGFIGTHNVSNALEAFDLMANGWDEAGDDYHKCANGCVPRKL